MATLPESVDHTDKDFDALRARLIALVKSVFPDWNDFDVASFGKVTEPVRVQLLAPAIVAAAADAPRVLALVENSKAHTQLCDARGLADVELHLDVTPRLDKTGGGIPTARWRCSASRTMRASECAPLRRHQVASPGASRRAPTASRWRHAARGSGGAGAARDAASWRRARKSRLITVPTGIPSASAASR